MFTSFKIFVAQNFMRLCWLLPIQDKVVFTSYVGKYCNDNPRAIYEQLKIISPKTKFVWTMLDGNVKIPGAVVAKVNSFAMLYHFATARVWIDNARKPWWMIKRNGQFYVQTWHGDLGVKKIEAAVEHKLPEEYIRCAKHDSQMMDVLLVGNEWFVREVVPYFWYKGNVLKLGMPREDKLFQDNSLYRSNVRQFYDLGEDERIVLYVPTFRNSGSLECYRINWERVLESLSTKYGGKWKAVVRLHPNISEKHKLLSSDTDVKNGSLYEDVNELVVAADLVISDYSSVMFDAVLAGKKVMIYASDFQDYVKERDVYFSLNELPFSVATNNQELLVNIENFDEKKYRCDVEEFLSNKGVIRNPNASHDVAKYIVDTYLKYI